MAAIKSLNAGDDGLIHAYILYGKGSGRSIGWGEIDSHPRDSEILWMHLDYENPIAQGWLYKRSGLEEINCTVLLEEDSRPRFVNTSNGLLFILRGVNCNPGSDPDDMVSLRMWFEGNRIITMRHRKVMAIDDIHNALLKGSGPESSVDFLIMAADRLTYRIGDVISSIDDAVDELEEQVLTAESREIRSQLSTIRRQSISLRRYISPQRDVLGRLYNERIPWVADIDRLRIREISERTMRYVEDLDSARDRAAITHEELNSRLSEQMNKIMYLLSIVAAIFLPLGLLTGLLGINVGGIPGAEYRWSFLIVCIMLAIMAVLLFVIFKRKRML